MPPLAWVDLLEIHLATAWTWTPFIAPHLRNTTRSCPTHVEHVAGTQAGCHPGLARLLVDTSVAGYEGDSHLGELNYQTDCASRRATSPHNLLRQPYQSCGLVDAEECPVITSTGVSESSLESTRSEMQPADALRSPTLRQVCEFEDQGRSACGPLANDCSASFVTG